MLFINVAGIQNEYVPSFDLFDRTSAIKNVGADESISNRDLFDRMCEMNDADDAPIVMLLCPEMHVFMQEQIEFLKLQD